MTVCLRLLTVCAVALFAGCPRGENADVEHRNVCIDLSPDGKTLVFSSAEGDLYLFDMQRAATTRLTATERIERFPSFSPDGKLITFAAAETESAPSRICILTLGDLSVRDVTESREQSDILPRFTPDGAQIVFARAYRRRPYSLGGWIWDQWDVCAVGVDSRKVSRVTREGYYQLYRIVPRSDGSFIYAADTMGRDDVPRGALYAVRLGGNPSRLIPEAGVSKADVHAWAADPMVAPDGKTIAYISDRSREFWYDVCVQTDDAQPTCLLGSRSRYNGYPDFFPDGQRLVFLAGTEFNAGSRAIYSLWQVSLAGKVQELAPPDLFTNPTNWLAGRSIEPSKSPESP